MEGGYAGRQEGSVRQAQAEGGDISLIQHSHGSGRCPPLLPLPPMKQHVPAREEGKEVFSERR